MWHEPQVPHESSEIPRSVVEHCLRQDSTPNAASMTKAVVDTPVAVLEGCGSPGRPLGDGERLLTVASEMFLALGTTSDGDCSLERSLWTARSYP